MKGCILADEELVAQGRVATRSATRALAAARYADDEQTKEILREIFDTRNLNHTEMARCFGLYKETANMTMKSEEVKIQFEKKVELQGAMKKAHRVANDDGASKNEVKKRAGIVKDLLREKRKEGKASNAGKVIMTARDDNERQVL